MHWWQVQELNRFSVVLHLNKFLWFLYFATFYATLYFLLHFIDSLVTRYCRVQSPKNRK